MGLSMKISRLLTACGAIALLALTACSSEAEESGASDGSDSSQAAPAVFDFTTETMAPVPELTVKFPDELVELAASNDEKPVFTSIVMTGQKLEGGKACAADMKITYADGGLEALKDTELRSDSHEGETVQETVTPRIFGGGVTLFSLEEFDPSDPKKGAYVSEDMTTIKRVSACAKTPMDEDRDNLVHFPHQGTFTEGGVDYFADAHFAFMSDGTVAVSRSEIEGDYTLDSNGTWIS